MTLDISKATELRPGGLYCIESDVHLTDHTRRQLELYLQQFVDKHGVEFLILEPPYTLAKYVAELNDGPQCPPHRWETDEDVPGLLKCAKCGNEIHSS